MSEQVRQQTQNNYVSERDMKCEQLEQFDQDNDSFAKVKRSGYVTTKLLFVIGIILILSFPVWGPLIAMIHLDLLFSELGGKGLF